MIPYSEITRSRSNIYLLVDTYHTMSPIIIAAQIRRGIMSAGPAENPKNTAMTVSTIGIMIELPTSCEDVATSAVSITSHLRTESSLLRSAKESVI